MKSAEIMLGGEYVVAVRPKHVLIPGTDVTYQERYEALRTLMPRGSTARIPAHIPEGARRELRRLEGALARSGSGLISRLLRCRHLDREGVFRHGEFVVTQKTGIGFWDSYLDRISVIATVSESLGQQRYRVTADFIEERDSQSLPCFDPAVPEKADVDDEADEEEIDAWWDAHWNGLHDYAGTLEAVVHRATFFYPWEDGLVERLNEEHQREAEERQTRWAEETAKRQKEYGQRRLDQHGAEIVDDVITRILSAGDDWEALA